MIFNSINMNTTTNKILIRIMCCTTSILMRNHDFLSIAIHFPAAKMTISLIHLIQLAPVIELPPVTYNEICYRLNLNTFVGNYE